MLVPKNVSAWLLILILSTLLKLAVLFILPVGQTPDELFIFKRIWNQVLVARGIENPEEQIKNYPNNVYYYPPLYYFTASFLLNVLLLFSSVPATMNQALADFYVPLRLFSLLVSTFSLVLMWKILSKFHLDKYLGLSVFTFIALLPENINFSIFPNHNVLLFFLITLFLFVLFNVNKAPYWKYSVLGIITGFALLTHFIAVILLPVSFVYILFSNDEKKKIFSIYLIFCLAAGGFWYLNNIFNFGWFYDRSLVNGGIDSVKPFSVDYYPVFLFFDTFNTFFASYGVYNNIRVGYFAYAALFVSLVVFSLGFLKRPKYEGQISSVVKASLMVLFFGNLSIFLFFNLFYELQAQGRLLFPSILAIAIFVILGLSRYFSAKNLYLLTVLIFGVFTFLNWWGLGCLTKVFYGFWILPPIFSCIS